MMTDTASSQDIIQRQRAQIEALQKHIAALESHSPLQLNQITDHDIHSILNEIDQNETEQESKENQSNVKHKKAKKRKKKRTKLQKQTYERFVSALKKMSINECKEIIESARIDVTDEDFMGRTLLMQSAMYGQYEMCEVLLNMGSDIHHRDKSNQTAIHHARDGAYYHVEQLLYFHSLGADMGQRVQLITKQINKQNGIIKNMFAASDSKHLSLDNIVQIMVHLIQQKLAFSDDMLAVAWMQTVHQIIQKNQQNDEANALIDSDLFQCIAKASMGIIRNNDPKDWYFFKQYLLPSTIWFRSKNIEDYVQNKQDNDLRNSLYSELFAMINSQSNVIRNELRDDIQTMSDKNETEWNSLRTFRIQPNIVKCRQDTVANGLKGKYLFDELLSLSSGFKSFNAISHYDINEYLSDLVLVAHIVDDVFQDDIKNVFSTFGSTNKLLYSYLRGPVKLLKRARAKTETDYRLETFPRAACVLDFNRCTILFDDISHLLNALQLFTNAVQSQNAGCMIDIVRDKNGFIEYTHDTPQYADVKLNVLIHYSKKNISIVGEVQFMLASMMKFKKSAHNLYQVTRNQEYVQNVLDVLPMSLDQNKMLFVAGNLGDVDALCQLMVCHRKTASDLLMVDPISQESIVVNIIALNNLKALQFIMSISPPKLFEQRVFLKNRYNISGFTYCIHLKLWAALKIILQNEVICSGVKPQHWLDVWEGLLLSNRDNDLDMELLSMVLNNPHFENEKKLKRYLSCTSLANLMVFPGDIHWQIFRMVFEFEEIKCFIQQNMVQTVADMLCKIGKNYGDSLVRINAYLHYIEHEIIKGKDTNWNAFIHHQHENIGNMLQSVVRYENTNAFCEWILSQLQSQQEDVVECIINGTKQQMKSPLLIAASANNKAFLDLVFAKYETRIKVTANHIFMVSRATTSNVDTLNCLMAKLSKEAQMKLKTEWKCVWKDIASVYRFITEIICDGTCVKLQWIIENIFEDNDSTLEALLRYNDNDKYTLLLYAMKHKQYDHVRYLHQLVQNISNELLKYNMNYHNQMEESVLLLCCSHKFKEQSELLTTLIANKNVNVLSPRESDGTNVFQIACRKGLVECAHIILQSFADNREKLKVIHYTNKNGKSALELCKVIGKKGANYRRIEKQIELWKKEFADAN
eukprot:121579_1